MDMRTFLCISKLFLTPVASQIPKVPGVRVDRTNIWWRKEFCVLSKMSELPKVVTEDGGIGAEVDSGSGDEGEPGNTEGRPETEPPAAEDKEGESRDADVNTGGEEPRNKLSRRARKRLIRAKQRENAKKGPSAKKRKKEENRDINFTEENLYDAEYYIENGLRKVYPYPFKFTTYAKGRWLGQKILDIFGTEFKAYPMSVYEKAINAGQVTVNGKKVSPDYIFKDNDYVENVVHRHELPVTAEKIRVVTETDDVVVIDKPSSIPIHPCGRYRHNSLTYILAKELGLRNLRTIYRLDRLTSGVFIMCKTDRQTVLMQKHIKNRQVQKSYVARVCGEFPSEPVDCREPIDILTAKIGLLKVGPGGKESRTEFERLSYNGETSVVLCKPYTGRTHQIRVHLQYLGYPIVNDPLYNTPAWGPARGKGGDYGKSEEQLIEEIVRHHSAEQFEANLITDKSAAGQDSLDGEQIPDVANTESRNTYTSNDTNKPKDEPMNLTTSGASCSEKQQESQNKETDGIQNLKPDVSKSSVTTPMDITDDDRPRFDPTKLTVDPICEECKRTYLDPRPEQLVMYLHALSYSGPGWKYETNLPDWAHDDWKSSST